jgi:hypothetical protein
MHKLKKTIPIVEAKQHARLSASGSGRWTVCHAAPSREDGLPDSSSDAANWGTVAHDLSEKCLKAGDDLVLSMALGKDAHVQDDGTVIYRQPDNGLCSGVEVTQELIDCAETYIEFVRDLAKGGELMVEQRLSIEHITGEPGARGTSDSVILFPRELTIVDLKGGFMKVTASDLLEGHAFTTAPKVMRDRALFGKEVRKPNTQLLMYAEAARNELEFFHEFDQIRLIVVQPRLKWVDEFVMSVPDFLIWVEWVKAQAEATRSPDAKAVPGPDQCQWCKAYPCADAERAALETAFGAFEELNADMRTLQPSVAQLGQVKAMLPMLRKYCDYIDARVFGELQAGRNVSGWKLIDGEQGDRKWKDELQAEKALIAAGLSPTDYKQPAKLISPTMAEALTKPKVKKLSKEAWEKLQANVSRAPGSPKVVEASDPRPARVNSIADNFDFEDDEPAGEAFDFFN